MKVLNAAGFTVLHHAMPSPVAAIQVMVNAGSYHEEVPGVAHFLEHMFFKGTELRDYKALNKLLAAIGESNAYTSQERTAFYIDTTGQKALRALDLLTEMLFRPAFSAEELTKERTVILQECQSRQDDPGCYFVDNTLEFIYGPKLGHEVVGTPESIMGMMPEHLRAFREAHYTRSNLVFLLVGDVAHVTTQDIERVLLPYRDLPTGTRNTVERVPWKMGTPSAPVRLKFKHQSEQAWLGLWTPWFNNREMYDLYDAPAILADALAGGMHSLLFDRIREELGLAYTVSMTPLDSWNNYLIGFFSQLQGKQVKQCQEEMLKVLNRVASEGVPRDVLEASMAHFEFGCASEAQTPDGYLQGYLEGYFENPDILDTYEERMARFQSARPRMPDLVRECAKRLVTGLTITTMNAR